ncbi:hypothetical protein [Noviherbaspirillum pedocola]|uniref:Uncharacterized protein n=1 Tax=Noviherbaspirillum pedocola TaxID=2801341 RepID=A0A934WA93_9BURK|nr:hypothetical protein [Noviherbaspirillum pedocola]MBK4738324.1 hypothetical protein [Noviherbaspirillum pedocola]
MDTRTASSRANAAVFSASRAADHDVAGTNGTPDARPRQQVSQWHYSLQAAAITFNAFSWPTILSPLLRPTESMAARAPGRAMLRCYRQRNLAAGMIFIDQMQPPQRVRFTPAASPAQEMLGYAIGMFFYIPFFALQTHLTNGWCSRNGSRGEAMARAARDAWAGLCRRLPPGAGRELAQRYPFNFVLARVVAQMASVGVGSVVGGALQRARGATLEPAPAPQLAAPPGLMERIRANPAAYASAALGFSFTNRMAVRIDRAAERGTAPSAAAVARLTTAVVAACVITAMVHPRDAHQSETEQAPAKA